MDPQAQGRRRSLADLLTQLQPPQPQPERPWANVPAAAGPQTPHQQAQHAGPLRHVPCRDR